MEDGELREMGVPEPIPIDRLYLNSSGSRGIRIEQHPLTWPIVGGGPAAASAKSPTILQIGLPQGKFGLSFLSLVELIEHFRSAPHDACCTDGTDAGSEMSAYMQNILTVRHVCFSLCIKSETEPAHENCSCYLFDPRIDSFVKSLWPT